MEYSKEEYDIIYVKNKVKYYSQIVEDIKFHIGKIKMYNGSAKMNYNMYDETLDSDTLYGKYYDKYVEYKDIWIADLKKVIDMFDADFYKYLDKCLEKVVSKKTYWEEKLKEKETISDGFGK